MPDRVPRLNGLHDPGHKRGVRFPGSGRSAGADEQRGVLLVVDVEPPAYGLVRVGAPCYGLVGTFGKRTGEESCMTYLTGLSGPPERACASAGATVSTATATRHAAVNIAAATSAVEAPKNDFLLGLNIAFPLRCAPYRCPSCRGSSPCGASSYLARLSGARRPLHHAWDALLRALWAIPTVGAIVRSAYFSLGVPNRCPYTPECVEGLFSEGRLQHTAYPQRRGT